MFLPFNQRNKLKVLGVLNDKSIQEFINPSFKGGPHRNHHFLPSESTKKLESPKLVENKRRSNSVLSHVEIITEENITLQSEHLSMLQLDVTKKNKNKSI